MITLSRFRAPLLGLLTLGLLATSCKKDNDDPEPTVKGLKTEAHDDNRMMDIMHENMLLMDAVPMTMDPDNDFALMMRVHHQGAIDMANEEKSRGDNAEMKAIAGRVIVAQTAEIAEMTSFLAAHNAHRHVMAFDTAARLAMERMDRAQDTRPLTGDTDQDFAQLMTDHHQSAIEMAQAELKYGHEAQMLAMAQKMIEDQLLEIAELQEWLKVNKGF
ncbi:MAG: DUF305 domain-containing protein [Hymenobacteraceae bacterium]|nr:DUF305 domain-containing protein [Hymenobacteraceae bacterium]